MVFTIFTVRIKRFEGMELFFRTFLLDVMSEISQIMEQDLWPYIRIM